MSLVIASRFRGPATSGNGGYTAGLVAARLTDTIEHQAVDHTLHPLPQRLEEERDQPRGDERGAEVAAHAERFADEPHD